MKSKDIFNYSHFKKLSGILENLIVVFILIALPVIGHLWGDEFLRFLANQLEALSKL